jgi:hypothetical protein
MVRHDRLPGLDFGGAAAEEATVGESDSDSRKCDRL